VSRIDLRVGGKYLNDMRSPEGKDFWSTGIFREVVAPERLVMTDSFADEKGNVVSASHYGMSVDFPLELLITVTFEESDGKTKMTLKHSGVAGIPAADFDGMRQGWNESFDKLDEYLTILVKQASKTKVIAEPGKQEFFITREFAAPREMVFKAFVDRELIVQWLGPRRLTMTIDKFEPRSGGS
jgi:uncharacterized protein YndB with AHSA1/START domain